MITPEDAESPAPLEELVHVEELASPPDPQDALERLADLPFVLFLDSVRTDEKFGRYSYLSAAPREVLIARTTSDLATDVRRLRARHASLDSRDHVDVRDLERTGAGDPFKAVRDMLRPFRSARRNADELPPFLGGVAGLFGYGLLRSIERVPRNRHDEFELPDLAVGLYDWVLAFDHARGTCWLVAHGLEPGGTPSRSRRAALAASRAREVKARLESVRPEPAPHPACDPVRRLPAARLAPQWDAAGVPGLTSNFSREDFLTAVARTIEYIGAGDAFQVNLSQRLVHPLRGAPIEFYRRLRRSNPGPFAAYFDLGEHVVASSSPEQFLALDRDGEVVTRPIKGTRSRGYYTPEEDVYLGVVLRESEKDRAENVMIVDLLRNDLSRVCRPGTVRVPRLFDLERHPTVHHLVSEVRGRLREGRDALDLLRASFPGGSITGAPKVRAMEIIAELEPTERGPYCGSLVWIGFDGSMGSSILIRTVTASRGWLQLPVGGGIIADSSPVDEYQETLDKAAGLIRAL